MEINTYKTGLIIFSRMDSARLPGKALLKIGPLPLLGHVIARTRRVEGNYRIVLATTDRPEDDPLIRFARESGIYYFRGPLENVADRALRCAETFGFDRFARICGDRVFLSPGLIDIMLSIHSEQNADLAATDLLFNISQNANHRTFPPGLMTEVISTRALKAAVSKMSEESEKEHVTKYFYGHPRDFRLASYEADMHTRFRRLNLTVDTQSDLDRAKWVMERLENPTEADSLQILSIMATHESARSIFDGARDPRMKSFRDPPFVMKVCDLRRISEGYRNHMLHYFNCRLEQITDHEKDTLKFRTRKI